MSLLATSVYYFAFPPGTSLLPSGIAGALSGAIPLFTFLSAALLLPSDQVTPRRFLGVVIGFGGVLLIARPWAAAGAVDTTGVLYMLLGSASLGLSFVYATYIPPVVALAIGWLLVDEPLDILDAVAVGLILVGVVVLRSRRSLRATAP